MQYWFNLLFKSQNHRLYWGVFWAFMTALSAIGLLALSGWFITATALTGVAIGAGIFIKFDMYLPGSGIRFFALSRTLSRYIERIYNHDTILRLISTFRLRLFKGLSSLPFSELRATSDSDWLSKLTADLDSLDSILIRYTIPPIVATLLIVTLSLFLSFIWFELAIYLGAFLLLCIAFTIILSIKKTKGFAESSSRTLSELRADIIEHLKGATVLQSQHLMQAHEAPILKRLDEFYKVENAFNQSVANIQLLLDITLGLVITVLVFIGLYSVESSKISAPTAVMLVMLFIGVSEILQSLPSQFSAWGKTSFSANRLKPLAMRNSDKVEAKEIVVESISVRVSKHPNIPKSHESELMFTLQAERLHLIYGRSGTGKSSLARLMLNTDKFDSTNTKIVLNSKTNLADIPCTDWHRNIAYLEQSNAILAGTLVYNLTLGMSSISENLIWEALKLVELDTWVKNLPQGLNTWLGETGGKVSGGQARRIGLCRILLRRPQFVILDEPFNGLDGDMTERIWQNIQPWILQRMTVLLTHEKPTFLNDNEVFNPQCLDVERD
ncbi:amino acid ABC transporter ATP-binding/permease protein [Glaciecola sp. MF2-115]|uniref:amino acid ABC transporter ATP-binding/permease protein n=1 Tax=Glaciecola sp. MF2-115 TaxID=3384827 RepID=UPI00399FE28F